MLKNLRDLYFESNQILRELKGMYEKLIRQDIRLRLDNALVDFEARSLTEKLSVITGGAIKCMAGFSGVVTGVLLLATSGTSYCSGEEIHYPLNTTLAQIPTGYASITNVPETIVNGSIYPGHIGVSLLVSCGTSNNTKLLTGVGTIVASGLMFGGGVADLFLNPRAATDLRSLITGRRVHPDINAIEGLIFEKVKGIGDASTQEELIASAVALVKTSFPSAAHVNVMLKLRELLNSLLESHYRSFV